jgi:hypothetical protein
VRGFEGLFDPDVPTGIAPWETCFTIAHTLLCSLTLSIFTFFGVRSY